MTELFQQSSVGYSHQNEDPWRNVKQRNNSLSAFLWEIISCDVIFGLSKQVTYNRRGMCIGHVFHCYGLVRLCWFR